MVVGIDGSRAFIDRRTGTENYSYQLLKALSKIDTKKHQFIVYIRPGGNPKDSWPGNFTFKKINWSRFWTQVGLAMQTARDRLDVLFVPSHTLPVIRRPGLKTVMTVHDLGVEYLPKMHQLKQRLYLKNITAYQFRSATRLIAVSKATKDDLVKRIGIDPGKIAVIHEGFNQKLFKPIKNELLINTLKHYDLELGKYFLFVGTVQPRKNLERLIRAFCLHLRGVNKVTNKAQLGGKIKLAIVGSKGWLSDEIYKLPGKFGIKDQVKFLGFVADKDLPALYSGAIALLFPSLFEGFGLPILEAQACGCPVLTSNISSMPEVAGKGAVLVNPESVEDIIRGIERVQETGIRQQLIQRGFANLKRFSWEKCAKETLKVLESV